MSKDLINAVADIFSAKSQRITQSHKSDSQFFFHKIEKLLSVQIKFWVSRLCLGHLLDRLCKFVLFDQIFKKKEQRKKYDLGRI